MFFGLPLRTNQAHHRPEGDAPGGVGVPLLGNLARLTNRVMSGSTREVHHVGGLAIDDDRATVSRQMPP